MQDDPEVTYVLRQRQLHVYRNGHKVLVLAGKAAPKILNEQDLLIQPWQQVLNFLIGIFGSRS